MFILPNIYFAELYSTAKRPRSRFWQTHHKVFFLFSGSQIWICLEPTHWTSPDMTQPLCMPVTAIHRMQLKLNICNLHLLLSPSHPFHHIFNLQRSQNKSYHVILCPEAVNNIHWKCPLCTLQWKIQHRHMRIKQKCDNTIQDLKHQLVRLPHFKKMAVIRLVISHGS